ncbi:unnamed protein product [marine sediment metagenome]|uniref:Uncharacterized protein n=1 Tax=marine sediment metagenome TaxID=412755 RepID=X0VTD9_9ZZZZ
MSIQIDESLFRYILMARVSVTDEGDFSRSSERQFWVAWLKQKRIDYVFGSMVGETIQKVVHEKIEKVDRENTKLKAENEMLVKVKELLKKWDIDLIGSWGIEDELRKKIELIEKGIPNGLMTYLDSVITDLTEIKRIMSR